MGKIVKPLKYNVFAPKVEEKRWYFLIYGVIVKFSIICRFFLLFTIFTIFTIFGYKYRQRIYITFYFQELVSTQIWENLQTKKNTSTTIRSILSLQQFKDGRKANVLLQGDFAIFVQTLHKLAMISTILTKNRENEEFYKYRI